MNDVSKLINKIGDYVNKSVTDCSILFQMKQ